MIRQSMDLRVPCENKSCRKCRERRSDAWRERLAALLAAWVFWLCGIVVVLLDGGLLAAVAAGAAAGGGMLALTLWATKQLQRRAVPCE